MASSDAGVEGLDRVVERTDEVLDVVVSETVCGDRPCGHLDFPSPPTLRGDPDHGGPTHGGGGGGDGGDDGGGGDGGDGGGGGLGGGDGG